MVIYPMDCDEVSSKWLRHLLTVILNKKVLILKNVWPVYAHKTGNLATEIVELVLLKQKTDTTRLSKVPE